MAAQAKSAQPPPGGGMDPGRGASAVAGAGAARPLDRAATAPAGDAEVARGASGALPLLERGKSLLGALQSFNEQPTGVVVVCLLLLTIIACVFSLWKFAPVLVPLTFAVFLAFLVEPILSAIVLLPQGLVRLLRKRVRLRLRGREPPPSRRPTSSPGALEAAGGEEEDGTDEDLDSVSHSSDTESLVGGGGACQRFAMRLQTIWDIVSILLCVVVLLGILVCIGFSVYATISAFDWNRYIHSPKLEEIRRLLARHGVNDVDWKHAVGQHQGQVMSVAQSIVGIFGDVVITLLLFFFCLVAILPGLHQQLPKSRMRSMMQRYLLCKTCTSLIIALAVMLSLWIMSVDLVPIFGMITFFLNFIPNIGSLFAILAPAPLVYLTPGSTIRDVVLVVVVPFLIHNSLGCILEPQLMRAGLDLHPLSVVVALTFWGSLWGVSGMILSVPITCAIRLWLQESKHPYASVLQNIIDNPLGRRAADEASPRRPGPGPAGME